MNFSKIKTFVMIVALGAAAVSCNQKEDNAKPAMPRQANEQMTIRYIDVDTLLTKYNLAKDFDEAATTMQNNYDAAEKRYAQQAQNMQNEFMANQRNNVYAANPAKAQQDQARYEKLMADAQEKLGKMQQDMANQALKNRKQLTDSIFNYIKIYAKEKHFDAVLSKAADLNTAAFYVDDRFDVTDEVVAGLNKRYTKVAPKKQ